MSTPPPLPTHELVEQLRDDKGLSVKSLASDAGMDRSTLQRRLDGLYPFKVPELAKIARVLEVPVASLIGEDAA